jgi:acetolactate synthase-1/2/3 large subunit
MTSMTGGEAIVSGLVAHGIDTVFGLPGAQVYGLFDAFHQAQLKVIGARMELRSGWFWLSATSGKGRVPVLAPACATPARRSRSARTSRCCA